MELLKRIYIEITNICNLNCSFCPPSPREKRMMTAREFEHILLQFKPTGAQAYFHVKGEPLLHPALVDFLSLAHQCKIAVNLTTNGTLLKHNSALLLNAPALDPHLQEMVELADRVFCIYNKAGCGEGSW